MYYSTIIVPLHDVVYFWFTGLLKCKYTLVTALLTCIDAVFPLPFVLSFQCMNDFVEELSAGFLFKAKKSRQLLQTALLFVDVIAFSLFGSQIQFFGTL